VQTAGSVDAARQAARIAARFSDLLGLRQAVGGVGLLLLFGWELVFPLSAADFRAAGIGVELWGVAVLVVGIAIVIAAVLWVNAWYRRTYGAVERTRSQKRMGAIVGGIGALAFLVTFEVDVFAQNYGHVLPVNLILFALAIWIIGYWLYLGRPFWHYILISAVGLVLGVAAIAGIPPSTFAWHIREATLYFGLATVAGGVIDHMFLTRSLPRSESPVGLES
jgi:hypothetical protein